MAIRSWQWQLRVIIEADPLTTSWEVAEELNTDQSTVIQHLKQIGRWKSSTGGCFMSWPEIKTPLFWSVVFSYSTQQCQTISWSDCDMWQKVDRIQEEMTSSVAGSKGSSKALPQAKLAPKKVMVTVWWSAASLIHYNFLNPSKIITSEKNAQQTDEMHQKLQCL